MQDYELEALLDTDQFDYTEDQIATIRTVLEDYEQDDDLTDYTNAVIAVAVGDETISGLGEALAQARMVEALALDRVKGAVRVKYEQGMSEYALAEQAQVSRSTIRAWLGKK